MSATPMSGMGGSPMGMGNMQMYSPMSFGPQMLASILPGLFGGQGQPMMGGGGMPMAQPGALGQATGLPLMMGGGDMTGALGGMGGPMQAYRSSLLPTAPLPSGFGPGTTGIVPGGGGNLFG